MYASYAYQLVEELVSADVEMVCGLPDTLLGDAYKAVEDDERLHYIPVTNESEMPSLLAGAYLGGSRGVMMMENSGLRQACEPIVRLSHVHGLPFVMIMSFRGDFGEPNWWGHNHSQTMLPLLDLLRIPRRILKSEDEIEHSVRRAWTHAESSQWPVALVLAGTCVGSNVYAPH